jgi:hypothetical protein
MMLLQKLGQLSNKTAQEVYKDLVDSKNNWLHKSQCDNATVEFENDWLHKSQSDNATECENVIDEAQRKPRFIIVQRVKELPKLFCSKFNFEATSNKLLQDHIELSHKKL